MTKRMTYNKAWELIERYQLPIDNFFTLESSEVDNVIAAANEYGYRKPRNANGSRARYFYDFLVRKAQNGKIYD